MKLADTLNSCESKEDILSVLKTLNDYLWANAELLEKTNEKALALWKLGDILRKNGASLVEDKRNSAVFDLLVEMEQEIESKGLFVHYNLPSKDNNISENVILSIKTPTSEYDVFERVKDDESFFDICIYSSDGDYIPIEGKFNNLKSVNDFVLNFDKTINEELNNTEHSTNVVENVIDELNRNNKKVEQRLN